MRILVTAASRHGSTLEMASALGKALTDIGLEVEVKPMHELDGVAGFNAVVLGSAVYMGRWLPEASDFVQRHAVELGARPVWLFSSGPVGSPDPKPVGDPTGIAELIAAVHARGHHTFAALQWSAGDGRKGTPSPPSPLSAATDGSTGGRSCRPTAG